MNMTEKDLRIEVELLKQSIAQIQKEMTVGFSNLEKKITETTCSFREMANAFLEVAKGKADREWVEAIDRRLKSQEKIEIERNAVLRAWKGLAGILGISNLFLVVKFIFDILTK